MVARSGFCTRDGGAQGDEGNGIDRVLKVNEAPQMGRNVANDGSAKPNHKDGHTEGREATLHTCRRWFVVKFNDCYHLSRQMDRYTKKCKYGNL